MGTKWFPRVYVAVVCDCGVRGPLVHNSWAVDAAACERFARRLWNELPRDDEKKTEAKPLISPDELGRIAYEGAMGTFTRSRIEWCCLAPTLRPRWIAAAAAVAAAINESEDTSDE